MSCSRLSIESVMIVQLLFFFILLVEFNSLDYEPRSGEQERRSSPSRRPILP